MLLNDTIQAFTNPSRKTLRNAKNSMRDYIAKKKFFQKKSSSVPSYNITRFLNGLGMKAIKDIIGLRCVESRVCSACGYQVILNRQWLVADVKA